MSNNLPLLQIDRISHSYDHRKFALDDINLNLSSNEVVGIVGESGCGKTTLAKILGTILIPSHGSFVYKNIKFPGADKNDVKKLRRDIRVIFQNPETTINPKMSLYSVLIEPLRIYKPELKRNELDYIVGKTLEVVNLSEIYNEIHQKKIIHLSGGQKRRLSLARGIIVSPRILIADEPTSGLDLSIQGGIIQVLRDLSCCKIIISHNLSVITSICNRVIFMYKGRIVEEIKVNNESSIFNVKHPFSVELLKAAQNKLTTVQINDINKNKGCVFSEECNLLHLLKDTDGVNNHCLNEHPQLFEINKSHKIACFLVNGSK